MILLTSILEGKDAIGGVLGGFLALLGALGVKHWLPSVFTSLLGTECKKELHKMKLQIVELATAFEMYLATEDLPEGSPKEKASNIVTGIIEKIKVDNQTVKQ